MHIAFLGSPDSSRLADLRRAARDDHSIEPISYRHLHSALGESERSVGAAQADLGRYDGILVGAMPSGSLEQVVFRMDALAELEATGVTVLNPPKALEAAIDKYLATARLRSAGLLVPRTRVCQTAADALIALEELGDDVVLKPLFGGEGRGVTRLTDKAIAQRAFSLLENLGAVIYLQEFIPHQGCDLRLLVIGQRVLGIRRSNADDWRTNISLGGVAQAIELDDSLAEMAFTAAQAIGTPLAGVDLLPASDGRLYALEVNAVPGWRAVARVTGVDVARETLDYFSQSSVRNGVTGNPSAL